MKNVIRLFAISSLFTLIGLNAGAQEKKAGLVKAEKSSTAKTKVNAPVKAQPADKVDQTKIAPQQKVISKQKFDEMTPEQQKFILDNPDKYKVSK